MTPTNKYRAVATAVDGIRFHSKKEARRYGELKLLEKAGEITGLELQKKYPLLAPVGSGVFARATIGHYVADFVYREGPRGILRIEDTKGVRTALYRWKKKHFEAQYGLPITEV